MRILFVLCLVATVAAAGPGGSNPSDKAEADRLFEQALALLARGDRAEACKLFELSLRKDPRAVGTMLNVALCQEESGAIATAMRLYAEARDRAHDQNLVEHHEAAERKLALLAPRVPHLRIALPNNAPASTRVIIDDLVLSVDQIADVTVDPGTRSIVVTAPDRLPFETKLDIKEGEHRTLDVPTLQGKNVIVAPLFDRRSYGRIGVLAGSGLAIATGAVAYFGYHLYWEQFPQAVHDGAATMSEPNKNCFSYDTVRACNAEGAVHVKNARTLGNVATGLGIASVATLAIGGYLWWTAPKVALDVAADRIALAVSGSF